MLVSLVCTTAERAMLSKFFLDYNCHPSEKDISNYANGLNNETTVAQPSSMQP